MQNSDYKRSHDQLIFMNAEGVCYGHVRHKFTIHIDTNILINISFILGPKVCI